MVPESSIALRDSAAASIVSSLRHVPSSYFQAGAEGGQATGRRHMFLDVILPLSRSIEAEL